MDLTEKLREWGAAHAQARMAEHAFAQQEGAGRQALQGEAARLRRRADLLHREIYKQIGSKDCHAT